METKQNSQELKLCDWEAGWKTDTIKAYMNTLIEVISHPISYFGKIKPFKDYLSLCVFIYINSLIAVVASFGVHFTVNSLTEQAGALVFGITGFGCAVIFAPFVAIGFAFLVSAILHFCLKIVGGTKKGFETTVTVYGLGLVTSVFGVVPVLGFFITFVYTFLTNIGGMARAHEISVWRAAVAFFLPVLLCCCFIFLVAGIFGSLDFIPR